MAIEGIFMRFKQLKLLRVSGNAIYQRSIEEVQFEASHVKDNLCKVHHWVLISNDYFGNKSWEKTTLMKYTLLFYC